MSYKSSFNCRKYSLLAGFVLLCLAGNSQYTFTEADKLLADNQKSLGNDLVALIYKDGKVIYRKETGDLNTRTKVPVESCSKWFTAALVMTFVDEGTLSLDDKVSTYLPIFETYKKGDITIRQCLSHLTGIEDNVHAVTKLFERRKYESLEMEVNSFAQRGSSASPGTAFIYGNIGPDIAGRVLEVISKKKFDALAKQRLFTPLDMRGSSFSPEDNAVNPSGGAISTAADYMNFLAMILDKGKFMGKQILREAAVTQLHTIQTKNINKKYIPKVAEGYEYGLGEWIEEPGEKPNNLVVSSPGMPGSWPYVDMCRKYACILIMTNNNAEKQRDLHVALKNLIAKQLPATCQ